MEKRVDKILAYTLSADKLFYIVWKLHYILEQVYQVTVDQLYVLGVGSKYTVSLRKWLDSMRDSGMIIMLQGTISIHDTVFLPSLLLHTCHTVEYFPNLFIMKVSNLRPLFNMGLKKSNFS